MFHSPVLAQHVALSLMAFVFVYLIVFGAGTYYILKLIRKGPVYDDKKLKPEMPGRAAAPFQDDVKPV